MKIKEGYGMTRDGRKVKIERNGDCEEFPFRHDHGEGSFHGLTEEGMSCIGSDQDDIISMVDDDAASPVRTVTRREIVPGTYGHVYVKGEMKNHPMGRVCLVGISSTTDALGMTAHELRSAAMVLSQLAEALDDMGEEK